MGYNAAWFAFRTEDEASTLDAVGLEVVGEAFNGLDVPCAVARLSSGWSVVVSAGFKATYDKQAQMASQRGTAFSGLIYEMLMVSSLRCYQDGGLAWFVAHDPDEGRDHLAVKGETPPAFDPIRDEVMAEAAADRDEDVDFVFDVPGKLAAELTGFDIAYSHELVWRTLAPKGQSRRRGASKAKPAAPKLKDLVKAELVPFMAALGWRPLSGLERRQGMAGTMTFPMQRRRDGVDQVIGFSFWDRDALYLGVSSYAVAVDQPEAPMLLHVGARPRGRSVWARLLEACTPILLKPRQAAAIKDARKQLLIVQRFLDGEGRDRRLVIFGGAAKDTWPRLPDQADP